MFIIALIVNVLWAGPLPAPVLDDPPGVNVQYSTLDECLAAAKTAVENVVNQIKTLQKVSGRPVRYEIRDACSQIKAPGRSA